MKDYTRTVLFNASTLDEVISECKAYLASESWAFQKNIYTKELQDVDKRRELADKWKKLTHTAIFHDAIGKVVNGTDSAVYVATEY